MFYQHQDPVVKLVLMALRVTPDQPDQQVPLVSREKEAPPARKATGAIQALPAQRDRLDQADLQDQRVKQDLVVILD